MKTEKLLVVRVSVGRLFQAAGPATLNANSTNFSDVRGTSKVSETKVNIEDLQKIYARY